ncbi:MAG: DUF1330 domain-containing protein [Proteobacteria bacterium]|nr:MAG: DUF1330 domain-containing protein [Pseudomonadota bacterium]
MSAYVLAQLTIHDRARYDRYAARFLSVLARFEGRLLAADDAPGVVEGTWPHQKVVLIEFRDRDEAERWASSPEYRAIAVDREASTAATVLILAGLQPWTAR